MSFLTRKPENPTSASVSRKDAEQKENVFSETVASSRAKTVSLAEIYHALTDSQKQITEYLLAQEAGANDVVSSAQDSGSPAVGNGIAPGEIHQLFQTIPVILERLNMLGQFMDQQMIPGICQRFDQLEALLRQPSADTAPTVPASSNSDVSESSSVSDAAEKEQEQETNAPVRDRPNVEIADIHSAPVRPYCGKSDLAQLNKAFFGEMALEPSIQNELEYILRGILERDPICSYFGGVIMMFQSSAPDKMVLLLKDLGEALYRWVNSLPENDLEHFLEIMVRWTQWLCENAGLQNRIELARPGQRFDATRHNSTARGVAVTQVHGWVVLRGNGSVYSKALVDVQ